MSGQIKYCGGGAIYTAPNGMMFDITKLERLVRQPEWDAPYDLVVYIDLCNQYTNFSLNNEMMKRVGLALTVEG